VDLPAGSARPDERGEPVDNVGRAADRGPAGRIGRFGYRDPPLDMDCLRRIVGGRLPGLLLAAAACTERVRSPGSLIRRAVQRLLVAVARRCGPMPSISGMRSRARAASSTTAR